MNERIKELAKQAEQAADAATYAYDDDTGKWQKIWNEVYDEKFAELLVNACATLGDYAVNGGVLRPSVMIKEYFGVE